jgi:Domain of unknown function (DUF4202)
VVTGLVDRALAWVDEVHPHPRHLARTLDWLLVLDPDAGEGLRIAAVVHDIERAFPSDDDPYDPQADPDGDAYNEWHQQRCARIAREWLGEQGAPQELVRQVGDLVAVHESGGWPEADLLQAADSLSFLEVQVDLFLGMVASGGLPHDRAVDKLRFMDERIRVARARELAAPLLEAALARFDAAPTPSTRRA